VEARQAEAGARLQAMSERGGKDLKQVILFYKVGCPHCRHWLRSLVHSYFIADAGVVFRFIWIQSGDPLVQRYKEQLSTLGVPLFVVENQVGNSIQAIGMVGMTTEWFAEGSMKALREWLGAYEPMAERYL